MKAITPHCLKDYKNKHYWESIGVFARQFDGEIMQVYKCTQCQKCMLQKLKEIVRVYQ